MVEKFFGILTQRLRVEIWTAANLILLRYLQNLFKKAKILIMYSRFF